MTLQEMLYRCLMWLPPELSHTLALKTLNSPLGGAWQQAIESKPCSVMGITFPNPLGLAAGLDKNGDYLRGLSRLGFGFIEIGTITPKPQAGNPKPRLFRLLKEKALINRMGFNNRGVDYLLHQVEQSAYSGILGINIGKNATTPLEYALQDYQFCLERVYAQASYIVVNISSPNTPQLRQLQQSEALKNLLMVLKNTQIRLAKQSVYKPLVVKLAPDLSFEEVEVIAKILQEQGIDGVIAGNTTVDRVGLTSSIAISEQGGLSGRPLFAKAYELVKNLHACLGESIPIIACGGIDSGERAEQMLAAGAKLLQIYTGLIYQGPALIAEIIQQLNQV